MAYDSRIMRAALEQYQADLTARKAERQRRIDALCQQVPRLAEIQRELRGTAGRAVAAAFRKGVDPVPAIQALSRQNLALQRERAELLVEAGAPYDLMNSEPACPSCRDTGFTQEGPCACLMAYYTKEQNQIGRASCRERV